MKLIRTILATTILFFVISGCCILGDACDTFWVPVIEATENAK